MEVPLLEWIDQKSVILMVYPQTLDVSNVIASLITIRQLAGKLVLLLVQDPKSVSDAVGTQLPDSLFSPYEDNTSIQSALNTNSYIFIDNPSLFREARLDQIFINKSPQCKLIFFATIGITDTDVTMLNVTFNDIGYLRFSLASEGPEIDYMLESTLMTQKQTDRYNARRQTELELQGSSDPIQFYQAQNYIYSMQIGNFLYPPDIQQLLDTSRLKNTNIPSDTDQSQGGWLTEQVLDTLNTHSPKLAQLLTSILTHYNTKHIIYSRYLNHFGVILISTLLYYLGVPHLTLVDSDNFTVRADKVNSYNSSTTDNLRVLVTNIIPTYDLLNIGHLHFVEGIEHRVYKAFIDRVYKKRLTQVRVFSIHIYVTQKADGTDAADAVYYRPFTDQIMNLTSIYDTLYSQASPIIAIQGTGLAVAKPSS